MIWFLFLTISQDAEHQSESIHQMKEGLEQVQDSTQLNAATSEELASASKTLAAQVGQLHDRFKFLFFELVIDTLFFKQQNVVHGDKNNDE